MPGQKLVKNLVLGDIIGEAVWGESMGPNTTWQRVWAFFFVFETGSPYVVQAELELRILLPQPPKYWDYTHAIPYQT
jgi:hypothetical protein